MKKFISLFVFLAYCSVYSQSLSIFDVDTANFPIMKAKFLAFDKDGKQIRPYLNDFSITENGQPRTIINLSCPDINDKSLSIVFAVDVTIFNDIDNAKNVLLAWLELVQLGKNEIALMTYDGNSYINQDFTTNKKKLSLAINSLKNLSCSEDHTGALIRPYTGAISIAKNAKYKPIVILLSSCSHFNESRKSDIIQEANKNNTSINFVIFDRYDWTPEICKDIAKETGGFSNNHIPYNDIEAARASLFKILIGNQNSDLCEIEWQSGVSCQYLFTNVEIKLNQINFKIDTNYLPPNISQAKLVFNPKSLNLKNSTPGIKKDTTITITARNADFNITNITVTNAAFSITPTSFSLKNGESKDLTVTFLPPDSGYIYCKFTIENDFCPAKFYTSGGFPGKKAAIRTLKLIQPNGGELFVAGTDTVITWEGVSPDEHVTIEYRTDDNQPWIKLTDTAKGLSFKFHVPKIASNKYLARVTVKAENIENVCIDGEVLICNQIWMCKNLDVDTYRNGDPILEVTDLTQWGNLKTGAWCYYNNDPVMGEIYGKLYNWYAVNDPRGLAPNGYHISTDAEWTELETCLGGSDEAGGKLKSTGTIEAGDGLWFSPNTGATNSSGFTSLPGGYRDDSGNFIYVGSYSVWWYSAEFDEMNSWYRFLVFNRTFVQRYYYNKVCGYSVRCVRDK